MQYISYTIQNGKIGRKIPYTEANEALAKVEADAGEYNICEEAEPTPVPTQLDLIEAQVTYTAMMTDTLLEV